MRLLLLISFMVVLVCADTVAAQDDLTRGVQIGLHGGWTSWDLGDIEGNSFDKESGLAFGGSLGWGMSDWIGVFTRLDLTNISPENLDSYTVTHWDIGIRAIPMLLGKAVRPYAEAFGAFRFLDLIEQNGFEISASGAGFGFGIGLYAFVTNQFAINAGFGGAFGSFDEVSFGGFSIDTDVSATSLRFAAGVTWFP